MWSGRHLSASTAPPETPPCCSHSDASSCSSDWSSSSSPPPGATGTRRRDGGRADGGPPYPSSPAALRRSRRRGESWQEEGGRGVRLCLCEIISVIHILLLQAELMQLFVEAYLFCYLFHNHIYSFEQLQQQQCLVLLKAPHVLSLYLDGVCLPACLSTCLSVYLPACLSTCLFVCLPACLSVYLSVCLSTCLPACLSACLPVCLPACLQYWGTLTSVSPQQQQLTLCSPLQSSSS